MPKPQFTLQMTNNYLLTWKQNADSAQKSILQNTNCESEKEWDGEGNTINTGEADEMSVHIVGSLQKELTRLIHIKHEKNNKKESDMNFMSYIWDCWTNKRSHHFNGKTDIEEVSDFIVLYPINLTSHHQKDFNNKTSKCFKSIYH